jgi:hypothetical protein
MNIRSDTFDLIARDVALRVLPVTDGDRVHPGQSNWGTAQGSCFIELEWAVDEREDAPAGSLCLTVRAHLPRHRAHEHLLLDFLLQRARMVLAAGAPDASITSHYHGTLCDVADSGADTLFKSSSFQIAPRPAPREGTTHLRLVPWNGGEDLDAIGSGVPDRRARSMN